MNEDFVTTLGALLEQQLEEQETNGNVVSLLASGASFEMWLSFETRLLMEQRREQLGLSELTIDAFGESVPRYWIGNEYNKVDLCILDVSDNGEVWEAAFEFKVIHKQQEFEEQVQRGHR